MVKSEPRSLSTFQESPTPSFETMSSLSDSDEIVLHDLQSILELATIDASSIPLQNLQNTSKQICVVLILKLIKTKTETKSKTKEEDIVPLC